MIITIPDIILGFLSGIILGILIVLFVGWYLGGGEYEEYITENYTPKIIEDKELDDDLKLAIEEFIKKFKKK